MIKLVWRTDVHFSDYTPSKRTGNWTDDVSKKLEWIGKYTHDHNIDAVIDGGDFFDIKTPSKNSHSLVGRTAKIHKGYACPVYTLVGNHDVKYGNIDYIDEQPLGVLFNAGVFDQFGYDKEIIFEKDNVKVRLVGIPYHGTSYDWDLIRSIKKGDEDYLLVACHLLASEKGGVGAMYEGEDIVPYSDLLHQGVDGWFFGHWHKDQGIVIKDKTTIVNTGSLTRGALHLDDLERNPCIVEVIADKQGISFNRIDLPVRDVLIAFKVEETIAKRENKDKMEEVVEKMRSLSIENHGMSLRDRIMQVKDVEDIVKQIAVEYLEKI
jgi:DNA repair exonuclease SbcCD nuclease subunit